jgi:hypothetical protein
MTTRNIKSWAKLAPEVEAAIRVHIASNGWGRTCLVLGCTRTTLEKLVGGPGCVASVRDRIEGQARRKLAA